jgi:hypothetical protein
VFEIDRNIFFPDRQNISFMQVQVLGRSAGKQNQAIKVRWQKYENIGLFELSKVVSVECMSTSQQIGSIQRSSSKTAKSGGQTR